MKTRGGLVTWSATGPVARIALNRPAKLNAINLEMLGDLIELARQLADDPAIRTVVIEGIGRAFCAGADIGGYDDHTEATFLSYQSRFAAMCRAFEELPKPVIAQVHGYALGGGLILANSCDLVVAGEDARLGLPEVKIGLFGGGPRITKLLTKHRAMELMLLGEQIGAAEGLALGLVNQVVPVAELGRTVDSLAATLARRAPMALAAIKRFVVESDEASLGVKLNLERAVLGYLFATDDAGEGVTAFVEKRAPEFRGS
jgi:enoyl-CoA hydratase/carnithine racemase